MATVSRQLGIALLVSAALAPGCGGETDTWGGINVPFELDLATSNHSGPRLYDPVPLTSANTEGVTIWRDYEADFDPFGYKGFDVGFRLTPSRADLAAIDIFLRPIWHGELLREGDVIDLVPGGGGTTLLQVSFYPDPFDVFTSDTYTVVSGKYVIEEVSGPSVQVRVDARLTIDREGEEISQFELSGTFTVNRSLIEQTIPEPEV